MSTIDLAARKAVNSITAADTENLDDALIAVKSGIKQVNEIHEQGRSTATHIDQAINTTSAIGTRTPCAQHLQGLLQHAQVSMGELVATATSSNQSLTQARAKLENAGQASDVEPKSSKSKYRPADDLPPPIVTPPVPLPNGVTDDPRTWPGKIIQGHLHPRFHFSSQEKAVAKRLAQMEACEVRPVPTGKRRTADSLVNGDVVEFKTLTNQQPNSNTIKRVFNDSTARGGQSKSIVIDARNVPLLRGDAVKGLFRFLNISSNDGKLTRVRIWGKDFDLDWKADN